MTCANSSRGLPLPGFLLADAFLAGELQQHAAVHDPVDHGGGGHRILEHLLPFAEGEVGGDEDTALLLVAFAEKAEEHIDFPLGKIDIAAEFVDDDDIEAVQLGEGGSELEVTLGREQSTGQLEGGKSVTRSRHRPGLRRRGLSGLQDSLAG